MDLPAVLERYPRAELIEALERMRDGGPYPSRMTQLCQNLAAYKYATVRVNEARMRESGRVVVDVISASLNETGARLLDELVDDRASS